MFQYIYWRKTMINPAGEAKPSDHPILHNVIAMLPQIEAAREETKRERRLPEPLVASLKAAGVFGMAMPRDWGGPELDPITQFRVIEALAMADGSVGWCAMINCDGGYFSAFLDQALARDLLHRDIWSATVVVGTPTGQAQRVPGGYRITGRFPFASGCRHSEWAWVGCVVAPSGDQDANRADSVETRHCLIPISQCEIVDTWRTAGLRGTGSNDLLVSDVFVGEERTFGPEDRKLVRRPGALYAFPGMYRLKGPAPALGIARYAVNTFLNAASKKTARRYFLGPTLEVPKRVRDEIHVQDAVGRAET
jgi:indole-3-acetate monooxygenase